MSITPGPWVVDQDKPQWVVATDRHVALAFSGDDHGHANARMISAVPDMINALQAFAMFFENSGEPIMKCWDRPSPVKRVEIVKTMRAAIAKATGEPA